MEHEYYSGISLAIMVYVGITKLGPKIAEFADKEIDVSFIVLNLLIVIKNLI